MIIELITIRDTCGEGPNVANFGIMPLFFKNPADYDKIEKGDRLLSDNWRDAVAAGEPVILKNERTGESIECASALSEAQRAMVLVGGLLNKITSQ